MKRFLCSMAITAAAVASLAAQETVSPITFQFGMGFTQGVGHTGQDLDTGWTTFGGGGYNFNRYLAAMININTNVFGLTSAPGATFSGGHLLVLAATLDPVVHLNPGGRIDPYITGGGGLYHSSFSEVYTVNKPGVDIGMGFAFGSKWHGKFFSEARYDHIFARDRLYSNFVPVTFGYRW